MNCPTVATLTMYHTRYTNPLPDATKEEETTPSLRRRPQSRPSHDIRPLPTNSLPHQTCTILTSVKHEVNDMDPKSALARQFKRLRPTRAPAQIVQRANRAIATDYDRLHESVGVGGDWANPAYGNYYATSVSIYSAIKLRADAMARAPLAVLRPAPAASGTASVPTRVPVDPGHPAQRLLDHVNPWHTRGDLWRATEINLCLWGSSFWALERDDSGSFEIWPLRSDRVRVLPEKHRHVKGFVYMGTNGPVPYTPDEIVWMRYYNPLEPFAGLSPLAPVRLSVDSGLDALRFNRNFFKNSAQPDFIFTADDTLTDAEIENFYHRWEDRYQGPAKAHRPAIASFIKDVKTLGFNHREMEFLQGLRWSLEDVSRTYGVPLPLLSDYQQATFANITTAEKLFWRNTIVPEMRFLEEHLNSELLPRLGYGALTAEFDLSAIEAMTEDETERVEREVKLLDRGVLTINEVRRGRNLPEVAWGDGPVGREVGGQGV